MSRYFSILIIVMLCCTSAFCDQKLIKSMQIISTLNNTQINEATRYIKEYFEANKLPAKQKGILHDFIQIGEFLQLSRDEQKSKARNLKIKHDIFRQCFTCKGSRYIERKNRCTVCKSKALCRVCGGDGVISRVQGNYIYDYNCTSCTDGKCTNCKGTRYTGGACDKCYLTDGSIDVTKAKKILLKMIFEYNNNGGNNNQEGMNLVEENNDKVNNLVSVSLAKVVGGKNTYSGFFLRENDGFSVIFHANQIIDPNKFECFYEGNKVNISEVYYSPRYQFFKLFTKDPLVDVYSLKMGIYDGKEAYVMMPENKSFSFYKVNSIRQFSNDHRSKGILLIQNRKLSGLFSQEKVVNRKNCQNWISKGLPFKSNKEFKAFELDFNSSFTKLSKKELDFDLLYLSQYLEWEAEVTKLSESKQIDSAKDLEIDYLRELKDSYQKNTWKTPWGKNASQRIVDTIKALEKVK